MIQSIALKDAIIIDNYQRFRVFDFNFMDRKHWQKLYCYAFWNGSKYEMIQQLYAETELYEEHNIKINDYKLKRTIETMGISNNMKKISDELKEVKYKIINNTKVTNWCKLSKQINEGNKSNKRIRKKMELSMELDEFVTECTKLLQSNKFKKDSINLIPNDV